MKFKRKYALVGEREINIFILDYDMKKNVEAYCDAHIVKMQLESVQMLCTTYWVDRVLGHKTKLSIDEQKLVKKIDELIYVIKQGGNIYMDGRKIGTSLSIVNNKIQ